jgi:hypothetical protein
VGQGAGGRGYGARGMRHGACGTGHGAWGMAAAAQAGRSRHALHPALVQICANPVKSPELIRMLKVGPALCVARPPHPALPRPAPPRPALPRPVPPRLAPQRPAIPRVRLRCLQVKGVKSMTFDNICEVHCEPVVSCPHAFAFFLFAALGSATAVTHRLEPFFSRVFRGFRCFYPE